MAKSFDSIGSCSLNVDVSVDYADRFESSNDTLLSAHLDHDSVPNHKPPSYVNLSCSLSGYTGINNYNWKSREGYRLSLTVTNEMTSNGVRNDSVDGCVNKTTSDTMPNSTVNTIVEEKSFVQQRIERLYGPGVLLQEFHQFKKRSSLSPFSSPSVRKNIASANNTPSKNNCISVSPPTLPVFRHLSPEFRAQLPISKGRKSLSLKENGQIIENGNKSTNTEVINNNVNVEQSKNDDKTDGYFYLNLVENEIKRIFTTADNYDNLVSDVNVRKCISDETSGFVRSVVGKAKLLTSQKLKQFQGLCLKCVNRTDDDPFPTTVQDLQGFWDMVSIQVNEVNLMFEQLEKIKNNNWIDTTIQNDVSKVTSETILNGSNKISKKSITSSSSNAGKKPINAASQEQRKEREIVRKKLLDERRKQMRSLMKNQKTDNFDNIEIFVPES